MFARQRAVPPTIVRPTDTILEAFEAQFGKIGRKTAGRRCRKGGGGYEGEPDLGQKGQNAKNADNHAALGSAVSCRNSRFGCCQRNASHGVTIAGAAGSG